MYITQVVEVNLRDSAKDSLSYNVVTSVEEWLKQWTCLGNFKAIISDTREQGIEKCREMLRAELVPPWLAHRGVKPEHFSFEVSSQEVDKDGRFWLSSSLRIMRDYPI